MPGKHVMKVVAKPRTFRFTDRDGWFVVAKITEGPIHMLDRIVRVDFTNRQLAKMSDFDGEGILDLERDDPNQQIQQTNLLDWIKMSFGQEARLWQADDGVTFTLTHHPTCYRRGPWRLLIEVIGGQNHHKWGCFDDQDQPMRYFHSEGNAKDEAEFIAKVLLEDRKKAGP